MAELGVQGKMAAGWSCVGSRVKDELGNPGFFFLFNEIDLFFLNVVEVGDCPLRHGG